MTVEADVSALGQTIFSLPGLFAGGAGRPGSWDLDYAQQYLWGLLDGMPTLAPQPPTT